MGSRNELERLMDMAPSELKAQGTRSRFLYDKLACRCRMCDILRKHTAVRMGRGRDGKPKSYELYVSSGLSRGEGIELLNLGETFSDSPLDRREREYLSSLVKPFLARGESCLVAKHQDDSHRGMEYITVSIECSRIVFPSFPKGSMYKGLRYDMYYTSKELGI